MPEQKPSSQSEPKGDSQPKQSPSLPPTPTANPAEIPVVVDARGGKEVRVQTVSAPVIPAGEVAIVQGPVVLANSKEIDQANPAGAPRLDLFRPRNAEILKFREELQSLQTTNPVDRTQADHDRIHELHYLVNGEQPPAK